MSAVRAEFDAISIHTPLAGSDFRAERSAQDFLISIHTPLAGSDLFVVSNISSQQKFQSTLPLRGATRVMRVDRNTGNISIHTPLAGSDTPVDVITQVFLIISIHTPLAGSDPQI